MVGAHRQAPVLHQRTAEVNVDLVIDLVGGSYFVSIIAASPLDDHRLTTVFKKMPCYETRKSTIPLIKWRL
jgi:NADPH:quinone reductase-like Zn-dependent oxidoreductase